MPLPALRGAIYDRNGNLLAASLARVDVVADDFLVTDRRPGPQRSGRRDPQLPAAALRAKLSEHSGYVPLAYQVRRSRRAEGREPRPALSELSRPTWPGPIRTASCSLPSSASSASAAGPFRPRVHGELAARRLARLRGRADRAERRGHPGLADRGRDRSPGHEPRAHLGPAPPVRGHQGILPQQIIATQADRRRGDRRGQAHRRHPGDGRPRRRAARQGGPRRAEPRGHLGLPAGLGHEARDDVGRPRGPADHAELGLHGALPDLRSGAGRSATPTTTRPSSSPPPRSSPSPRTSARSRSPTSSEPSASRTTCATSASAGRAGSAGRARPPASCRARTTPPPGPARRWERSRSAPARR